MMMRGRPRGNKKFYEFRSVLGQTEFQTKLGSFFRSASRQIEWLCRFKVPGWLRLLRGQPAGFFYRIQLDPRWREFCNFRPTRSLEFHAEQVCAKHLSRGSLVHG